MIQRYVVRSVTVTSDGMALEYVDTKTDYKTNGLVHNHVLYVPRDADYEEELDAVVEAINALLQDALQDMTMVESLDLTSTPEEEDDDEPDRP